MSFDGKAFGRDVVEAVKSFLAREIAPLLSRLQVLEQRVPERGEKGDPGRAGIDGKDGTPGRDGKDGEPGPSGKDADPVTSEHIIEAILSDVSFIHDAVARHLSVNPPPAGKDGRDGVDGRDGINGKDAPVVTREQLVDSLLPQQEGLFSPLKSVVAQYLTAFPPAAGRDGRDGSPGRDGKDGEKGADGINGKDGASGLDGKDGLGFDDLTVEFDGQRTATLKFVRGDQVKEFPIIFPVVLDQGVWKEGEFAKGDGVTWGGSFFIAQKDTATKPETPNSDWRLAVKRGRDGKDGKPGEKGDQGKEGRPGRDLTQMGLDGQKW